MLSTGDTKVNRAAPSWLNVEFDQTTSASAAGDVLQEHRHGWQDTERGIQPSLWGSQSVGRFSTENE